MSGIPLTRHAVPKMDPLKVQMSVPGLSAIGTPGNLDGNRTLTPSLGAVSARFVRTTPPVSPMKGETFFSVTK